MSKILLFYILCLASLKVNSQSIKGELTFVEKENLQARITLVGSINKGHSYRLNSCDSIPEQLNVLVKKVGWLASDSFQKLDEWNVDEGKFDLTLREDYESLQTKYKGSKMNNHYTFDFLFLLIEADGYDPILLGYSKKCPNISNIVF